ncbi:MAG: hypothetical protein NTX86_03230 [Candidatus Dependentiae bacterium]|nr:hypothetical protein [Candidatus Dependentiae bacterium]
MVKKLFSSAVLIALYVVLMPVFSFGIPPLTDAPISVVAAEATSEVTQSSQAVSGILTSIYNAATVQNKFITVTTISALVFAILYNYNEQFREKVRGVLGFEEENKICRFCPKKNCTR